MFLPLPFLPKLDSSDQHHNSISFNLHSEGNPSLLKGNHRKIHFYPSVHTHDESAHLATVLHGWMANAGSPPGLCTVQLGYLGPRTRTFSEVTRMHYSHAQGHVCVAFTRKWFAFALSLTRCRIVSGRSLHELSSGLVQDRLSANREHEKQNFCENWTKQFNFITCSLRAQLNSTSAALTVYVPWGNFPHKNLGPW